jgi:hypothetical protein
MGTDYTDGWRDCRTYAGEAATRSSEYRAGFAACLNAYHDGCANGTGWAGVPAWPRITGRNGLLCWDTPWGRAYSSECPPGDEPLTADEVRSLPDGVRILVLWGGGNGPHEYLWRQGMVFVDERDRGSRLGGLIGSWSLVGDEPHQDKVWAS